MEAKLLNIAMTAIEVKDRARRDYGDIDSLVESIKEVDLIQPIAVMDLGVDLQLRRKFQLLAGGRRFKAFQILERQSIPCNIYPFSDDPKTLKVIELTENLKRLNLAYAEEAQLTEEIHSLLISIKGQRSHGPATSGHSIRETAKMLGRSATAVAREIELANAIKENPDLANMKNKNEAVSELYKRKEKVYLKELSLRAANKRTSSLTKEKHRIIDAYLVQDVEEALASFDRRSFNFAEIDPPYKIELRHTVKMSAEEKELLQGGKLTEEGKLEYIEWLGRVLIATHRVLKENAWVIVWFAMDPWFSPVFNLLEKCGFVGTAVPAEWIKNYGNTRTPNIHLKNYYEPFFYMKKGNAMLARAGSKNTFSFPLIPDKTHATEKPIEMYMDILATFCTPNSTIISPFAGSGNCLLAAANMNMTAVGIDLNEENKQQFVAKVHRNEIGEYSSYR